MWLFKSLLFNFISCSVLHKIVDRHHKCNAAQILLKSSLPPITFGFYSIKALDVVKIMQMVKKHCSEYFI